MHTKACEECGQMWETRSNRARTCSPRCRAILREREKPSPGRPKRDYPADVIEQVRDMYRNGATIREIKETLGAGYRAQTLIERYVDTRRAAIPRDQTGVRNPGWKGEDAGYQAVHLRVITVRGQPTVCECCGLDDPHARYEWANLTGQYDDVTDYDRLCTRCHRRLDARRRAEQGGEPTTPPRFRRR